MELTQNTNCNYCYKPFTTADIFCNSCGYPIQGTDVEQKTFIVQKSHTEVDIRELEAKVGSARNSLYWIGGITAIWTAINFFTTSDGNEAFALLITNVILVGGFLSLAAWSKTKPAAALISGLSLYIVIQILNFIVAPASIFSGIIFKIIIIGYLINGIKAVLDIEKLKKENEIK
ncbi:hypothetical protein [Pedobacter sandarakinus]|uniref:hypothetical protein n=1 Tax=Pedobacter sandarakinus TaxID=353156 RepID=UPI002246D693|nr:hypothetical protein [Pedobacter sandarakinus]MCX2574465.1 hypothetical protein [Pedobacter sandarakinus]